MEVLLTEDVENLGIVGDIVEVADGYGRNYLLPKGIAVEPTEANQKRYEEKRSKRRREIEKRRKWAEEVIEELQRVLLEVHRKAQQDSDSLYGSVRREDITSLIKEETDIELNPSQVNLDRSIEELGQYSVELQLYEDRTTTVKLDVKRDSEEDAETEEE